ncbi:MAG: hypothetical protein CMO80_13565 [Verrucomicrobiales bacterium]|nr:hypothetical protein [Verrucomicrobiales bacterium]|tara:strand:+ start:30563 stop:31105 length:543 start_codon:yes stop_codon:yes gene_type:complete
MKLAPKSRDPRAAFTLIEIMMVIGLLVIMFSVSIPSFVNSQTKRPMRLATEQLIEALSTARAQAIIRGELVQFHIRPQDYTFKVVPTGQAEELDESVQSQSKDTQRGLFDVKLPPEVGIEDIRVNYVDHTQDEFAVLKFHSNGTSEDFKLILRSLRGEYRLFMVDPITGRPDFVVIADGH